MRPFELKCTHVRRHFERKNPNFCYYVNNIACYMFALFIDNRLLGDKMFFQIDLQKVYILCMKFCLSVIFQPVHLHKKSWKPQTNINEIYFFRIVTAIKSPSGKYILALFAHAYTLPPWFKIFQCRMWTHSGVWKVNRSLVPWNISCFWNIFTSCFWNISCFLICCRGSQGRLLTCAV